MTMQLPLPGVSAVSGYTAAPEVVSAIRKASSESGTPFETLLSAAAMESGFVPTAQASSSTASGLFQFTEQTWLSAVRQFGASYGLASEASAIVQRGGRLTVEDPALRQKILNLRSDPTVSAALAGEHLRLIAGQLTRNLGHPVDATETYLGHFLGTAGATAMLNTLQTNPGRPAADVLPEAASANPAMFYGKDGNPYSTAQFVQHVGNRVARTYAELGYNQPQGALAFAGHNVAGQSADPPDADASGWGTSTPRRVASSSERMMLATLAEVFAQMDRTSGQDPTSRAKRDHRLPPGIVSALAIASD